MNLKFDITKKEKESFHGSNKQFVYFYKQSNLLLKFITFPFQQFTFMISKLYEIHSISSFLSITEIIAILKI